MNTVYCNECKNKFALDEPLFHTIEKDGLTVQYFVCPHCGMKYHVFTADAEMWKLVEQRKAADNKLRIAVIKGFRKKILSRYEKECRRIEKKQKDLELRLKQQGEDIMNHIEDGQKEKKTTDENITSQKSN